MNTKPNKIHSAQCIWLVPQLWQHQDAMVNETAFMRVRKICNRNGQGKYYSHDEPCITPCVAAAEK